MEELNTDYFDSSLPVNTQEEINQETEYLKQLASNVGNYLYEYKDEFKSDPGANQSLNLGIMAQQINKVPGLNAAVEVGPDGGLQVDGSRLALSTLGYVATLAKLVLQMRGIEIDRSNEEMANEFQDSGRTNTGTTTEGNGGTNTTRPESIVGNTTIREMESQPNGRNAAESNDVYANAIGV